MRSPSRPQHHSLRQVDRFAEASWLRSGNCGWGRPSQTCRTHDGPTTLQSRGSGNGTASVCDVHEGWDRVRGARIAGPHKNGPNDNDCVDRRGGCVRFLLQEGHVGGIRVCSSAICPTLPRQPSRYLWEDEDGAIHHIHQDRDALMPHCSHLANTLHWRLCGGGCELERGFSLDDMYVKLQSG